MTELEQACRVIDELICLLDTTNHDSRDRLLELSRVDEGLYLIARRMNANDSYAVSAWLVNEMRNRGYLTTQPQPANKEV